MDTKRLLAEIAEHLEAAAAKLRTLADKGAEPPADEPALDTGELTVDEWVKLAKDVHPLLGVRQAEILREVAKAHPEGIGTGPVSRAIDYEQTNTALTLAALVRHGLVRKDPESRPQRYYLGDRLLRRGGGN